MSATVALASILVLAAATEALVEYLVAPWLKPDRPDQPQTHQPEPVTDWRAMALRYVAALVGVVLCLAYHADLLLLANLQSPLPWIGPLVTGLLIGRGANFINDFAGRYLVSQRA